jgi:hypothetical protein
MGRAALTRCSAWAGANTLVGIGGDDLFYVNNTADVVIEAANGGYDTVMAFVSYTNPPTSDGQGERKARLYFTPRRT